MIEEEKVELDNDIESDQGDEIEESETLDSKTSETSDSETDEESEDSNETDGEEELTVSIGEDSPPEEEQQKTPGWVKDVRKQNRELKKQNRDLQLKIESISGVTDKKVTLGKKPSLEDYDFDAERYEKEISNWFDLKKEREEQEQRNQKLKDDEQKEWDEKLKNYESHKSKLKFNDFDDAEDTAKDRLSDTQQGMIVQGADDPALVVYALGKNPKILKKLSDIKDPVKFAFEVAKMETKLKVSSKKRPKSAPESRVNSSGGTSVSGSSDSTLNRLMSEAESTGNYTKVAEYRRKRRTAS